MRYLLAKIFDFIRQSKFGLILLILLSLAILGGMLADDYGESWDEHLNIIYGEESLKAYFSTPNFSLAKAKGVTGPSSFMIAEVGARIFSRLLPGWIFVTGRHFTYFLAFLFSVFCFYLLCLRVASKRAALVSALLFLTQPLLWGHAFINPKDIPFMALFLAAAVSGLAMVESYKNKSTPSFMNAIQNNQPKSLFEVVGSTLVSKNRIQLLIRGVLLILGVIVALDVIVLHQVIIPFILHIIHDAYHGTSVVLINKIFRLVAQNFEEISDVDYLWKAMRLYWMLRIPIAIGINIPNIPLISKAISGPYQWKISGKFLNHLIIAAILMGIASSTRIIAPFVGLLISALFLYKHQGHAIKPLIAYWVLSASVGLGSRPDFWTQPINSLLNSLDSTTSFGWDGSILYQGAAYRIHELPASYSPLLLLRQFTEPLLLLIFVGVTIATWRFIHRRVNRPILIVMLLWSLLPIVLLQLIQTQGYDNFRQLFFMVPPVIAFSTIGVDSILHKLAKYRLVQLLFVILVLLPGIISIWRLHPYEYIYHNDISGGVNEAFRKEELDYWCTSYREAMNFVNNVAPKNARVEIWGSPEIARAFARPDLSLLQLSDQSNANGAEYVIICARQNNDLTTYPDLKVVKRIQIQGATLAVVKVR